MSYGYTNFAGNVVIDMNGAKLQEVMTRAILKKLNEEVPSYALPMIRLRLHRLIKEVIESSNTYESLLNGELRQHFGIRESEIQQKLDTIVDRFASSVRATFSKFTYNGNTIGGGIIFKFIRADFGDVINDKAGKVLTEKRQSLEWLRWLLLEGDQVIIDGYDIALGPNPASRAGFAIMVKDDQYWRVPPAYAGSVGDNWITRIFDDEDVRNRISRIIFEEVAKSVNAWLIIQN